jgi:hypothetical protein
MDLIEGRKKLAYFRKSKEYKKLVNNLEPVLNSIDELK